MKKLMIATVMLASATFAVPASAQEEEEFLGLFQGYLDIAEQFVGLANRTDAAVFFAVEGIVEIHEERGEQAKAIPQLKNVLDIYPDNQPVRNIVHFKLRDLYRDTGQSDLALAELEVLIEENK